ncbi:MAG: glucosylceramidase [Reichenbachiella sp.]
MHSKIFHYLFIIIFSGFTLSSCVDNTNGEGSGISEVQTYLTTPDEAFKFSKVDYLLSPSRENENKLILIDTNEKYQEMSGFGYNLTGGSAMHIYNLPREKRALLLEELFGLKDDDIGISYLRISLGASDLDETIFSYDDLSEGDDDFELKHFSIEKDKKYLIPLLKEILDVNSNIQLMATPWSPPTWMKTNEETKGGQLKPNCYQVYAEYFAKYIEAMRNEGINISAISVQNEPLHPGNNPSMYMTPEEQLVFIRDHLGPIFNSQNISTKILLYDHNADRIDYPMTILDDPIARQYVEGSAFHLYGGDISELSKVHEAYPDKNIYFTEQWVGAPGNFSEDVQWHVKNLIIGATRNWSKNVLEWNLAADSALEPHTDGGCSRCLGALTIDGDKIKRNSSYFIIAHASKFVRPGAVRIASNSSMELPNVAFSYENNIILIVLNNTSSDQQFNIQIDQHKFSSQLPALSVATYNWPNLNSL